MCSICTKTASRISDANLDLGNNRFVYRLGEPTCSFAHFAIVPATAVFVVTGFRSAICCSQPGVVNGTITITVARSPIFRFGSSVKQKEDELIIRRRERELGGGGGGGEGGKGEDEGRKRETKEKMELRVCLHYAAAWVIKTVVLSLPERQKVW